MTLRSLVLLGAVLFVLGCPDGQQQLTDGGAGLDGSAGPDLSCFTSPMTHVELLNACTSAQAIDKTPLLPLLRPDGTLPPLP